MENKETGLQVFDYESHKVRTVLKNNEVWFVAKDVCGVLGIQRGREVVTSRLEKDEADKICLTDSLGRKQETYIVNESGLYSLILRSNKPEAKKFKKWVTSEVLPSIRKTGSYSTQKQLPKTYSEALRQLADEVDKTERLQIENQKKEKRLTEAQPKADFYDTAMSSKDLLSFRDVSKILNKPSFGRNNLIKSLREKGILIAGTTESFQSYIERGYFEVIEQPYKRDGELIGIILKTLVTQKGLEFIKKYWTKKLVN